MQYKEIGSVVQGGDWLHALESDISMERSGDNPEVLHRDSGFIQAAGPIPQRRVSHLSLAD